MKELSQRLGLLVADDFLAFDDKALAQSLVEEASFLGASLKVGRLDVLGQGKRQLKGFHGLVVVDAQAVDPLLGGNALPPDAYLLIGKERFADLIGVVGGQELAFLPVELRELGFGLGDLLSGQHRCGLHLGADGSTEPVTLLIGQLLVGVGPLNGGLKRLDTVTALGAMPVLSAAADEVLVVAAVAFGTGVDQAAATVATVELAA